MSDREEEGSSRSGDEENDLSMLVVQEEEDEDAEQEGGGGGQTIQIDGTVLRAIAAAAQRNGESVSVGALLRRYLEVISGQNGGLGLGMGSEDEEEEDDDDDEAMSWMRGGGRGMRSRRRADEEKFVPDTSQLADSDIRLRILMDTGNWLETDPIPTDMESDMRIAPDPNTSSSSSSSSPSSSRHQHPLSFATDNERRTAMRTENVYRALKRRKVHTPVRERARGQGGVNSSPHGRSKLAHVAQKYIPDVLVEQMSHHSRVFCGQFSLDGSVYTSASQDQHIRLFKVDGNHNWKCFKDIEARHIGWSILDIDYSPNNRFICYSTWSPYIQICNIHGDYELHEQLDMEPDAKRFSLFSMKFSSDNREILGGGCSRNAYLYDVERKQRVLRVEGHTDDINTVAWLSDSPNLFLTGSDDCLVKLWDRRVISDNSGEREVTGSPAQPVAVFQGHQAGVTHVDSKQDGNYFISNGKDQCIKLWDIRRNTPGGADVSVAQPQWDYRHGEHSRPAFGKKQEGDTSVMTYRGHCVRETLIRSYFSPLETTGQRYIATGCYTGSVFVYDVLSGEVAKRLTFNRATVRDVSWHPRRPILVTASWDGTTLTLNAQSGKQGQQPKNVLAREVEGGPGGGMYW